MNFIERWFGVSPDSGDGSTERVVIVVLALAGAVIVFRRRLVVFAIWFLDGVRSWWSSD